jgi:hypothetical protein
VSRSLYFARRQLVQGQLAKVKEKGELTKAKIDYLQENECRN